MLWFVIVEGFVIDGIFLKFRFDFFIVVFIKINGRLVGM